MTKYRLLYLDPSKAYIERARQYLAANHPDVEFHSETAIGRAIKELKENNAHIVITRPFAGGFSRLQRELQPQQYGHMVVLSVRQGRYGQHIGKHVTFQHSRPFEQKLEQVVNSMLKPKIR